MDNEKIDPNETLQQILRSLTKIEELFSDDEKQEAAFGGEDVDALADLEENTLSVLDDMHKLDAHLLAGGDIPARWAEKAQGGILGRIALLLNVYNTCLDQTESFEDSQGPPGSKLIYVLGAIAKGEKCDYDAFSPDDMKFVDWLRGVFAANHGIWAHINVNDVEEDE